MPTTRSSKPPRPPSRSRFQEGSMNDRASNAPPVHFIGPDSFLDVNNPSALRTQPSARALRTKPSVGLKPSGVSTIRPVVAEEAPAPQPTKVEAKKAQNGGKRGSKQLLGQVWDGVREKLRLRKDPTPSVSTASTNSNDARKKPSLSDDRPSKDEVYANYHSLVASGFFTSHAIQSTRQPGPAQRPSTSQANGPAPAWPLPQLPLTPNKSRPASPVKSPASASSRGTKRAKDDGSDEEDAEDTQIKKIRKTVSTPRDLAIPKRRSSSRLNAAANRTFSNSRIISNGGGGPAAREPNKLTKRVLNRIPTPGPNTAAADSRRRNVSDMIPPAPAIHSETQRTLRPRRSAADVSSAHGMGMGMGNGGLRVRPNVNRGIPSVPDIPAKFTYGEDRENVGPWRGLRRGFGNLS